MVTIFRHTVRVWLILCLTLVAIGCQSGAPPDASEPPPTGTQRLTLWHSLPHEQVEVLQGIADEWASQQAGELRVELVRSPNEEALHQKLLAAVQSDMPPTLAFVRPPDIAAYVEADALLPLDTLAEEELAAGDAQDDYFTSFLDGVRYPQADNHLFAWPVHRHQTLLFVNRTRVEALGGAFPLSSGDELVELCAAHRAQGGSTCFAAFPSGTVAVLWVWSHGGKVVDVANEAPAFQGEAGKSVMRWLAALRALEGVHMVPTYDAMVDAFASGDTLFTFDSTQAIPTYEARINSAFDLAVVPPPSTDGEPVTLASGGNIAIFRSTPESQALAWSFLRFLTSTDVNYRWAQALGAYPVRRSALERLDAQWPADSRLRQAAEWLPFCRSEPLVAQWPAIEQLLAQAMINTINGQETPDAALAEAARRTEGLLKP